MDIISLKTSSHHNACNCQAMRFYRKVKPHIENILKQKERFRKHRARSADDILLRDHRNRHYPMSINVASSVKLTSLNYSAVKWEDMPSKNTEKITRTTVSSVSSKKAEIRETFNTVEIVVDIDEKMRASESSQTNPSEAELLRESRMRRISSSPTVVAHEIKSFQSELLGVDPIEGEAIQGTETSIPEDKIHFSKSYRKSSLESKHSFPKRVRLEDTVEESKASKNDVTVFPVQVFFDPRKIEDIQKPIHTQTDFYKNQESSTEKIEHSEKPSQSEYFDPKISRSLRKPAGVQTDFYKEKETLTEYTQVTQKEGLYFPKEKFSDPDMIDSRPNTSGVQSNKSYFEKNCDGEIFSDLDSLGETITEDMLTDRPPQNEGDVQVRKLADRSNPLSRHSRKRTREEKDRKQAELSLKDDVTMTSSNPTLIGAGDIIHPLVPVESSSTVASDLKTMDAEAIASKLLNLPEVSEKKALTDIPKQIITIQQVEEDVSPDLIEKPVLNVEPDVAQPMASERFDDEGESSPKAEFPQSEGGNEQDEKVKPSSMEGLDQPEEIQDLEDEGQPSSEKDSTHSAVKTNLEAEVISVLEPSSNTEERQDQGDEDQLSVKKGSAQSLVRKSLVDEILQGSKKGSIQSGEGQNLDDASQNISKKGSIQSEGQKTLGDEDKLISKKGSTQSVDRKNSKVEISHSSEKRSIKSEKGQASDDEGRSISKKGSIHSEGRTALDDESQAISKKESAPSKHTKNQLDAESLLPKSTTSNRKNVVKEFSTKTLSETPTGSIQGSNLTNPEKIYGFVKDMSKKLTDSTEPVSNISSISSISESLIMEINYPLSKSGASLEKTFLEHLKQQDVLSEKFKKKTPKSAPIEMTSGYQIEYRSILSGKESQVKRSTSECSCFMKTDSELLGKKSEKKLIQEKMSFKSSRIVKLSSAKSVKVSLHERDEFISMDVQTQTSLEEPCVRKPLTDRARVTTCVCPHTSKSIQAYAKDISPDLPDESLSSSVSSKVLKSDDQIMMEYKESIMEEEAPELEDLWITTGPQPDWEPECVKNAKKYLAEHKIQEVFSFLNSHLLVNMPDEPVSFLIYLLDLCLEYRECCCIRCIEPPLLFKQKHVECLFNKMDPWETGFISMQKYKTAMFTLGITHFNSDPLLTGEDQIPKEVFIDEALSAMTAHFEDIISIIKSDSANVTISQDPFHSSGDTYKGSSTAQSASSRAPTSRGLRSQGIISLGRQFPGTTSQSARSKGATSWKASNYDSRKINPDLDNPQNDTQIPDNVIPVHDVSGEKLAFL